MPKAPRPPAAEPPLKVLVIDSREDRAAVVKDGVAGLADAELIFVDNLDDIHGAIASTNPDVVIIDCDSPSRDTLESMRRVSLSNPKPIVMFVEESEPEFAREAIECGVSAYVVDGLKAERVRAVVDVAMLRFRLFHALKTELEKTKSDLASRKIIERAKGFLMEEKKLSEEEAYKLLRRSAMNEGKSILEIADNLLSVARLLKK